MDTPLQHLDFERSEGDDGVITLDAMASTRADRPAGLQALQAEAQAVLDWARAHFPHSEGPVEDGGDWLHDLQVHAEEGGWLTLTLSFSASAAYADAFEARWGRADND